VAGGITPREEHHMLKVLLPVDGSVSATRATQKLIETIGWYKEQPRVDLLAVHLPVPRFPNMSVVVSDEMLERYYADECEVMLAPSKKALDAARVGYTAHTLVGAIAESIIEQAKQSGSNMIYMGTRGMTALSNMVLGSITTRVLHLARIPVVLIH
jgi:nucleotide-binding universal stress UspA family protein